MTANPTIWFDPEEPTIRDTLSERGFALSCAIAEHISAQETTTSSAPRPEEASMAGQSGHSRGILHGLGPSLAKIALATSVIMTIYEAAKQVVYPQVTIWQSHLITAVFASLAAPAVAYFALCKIELLRQQAVGESAERLAAEHASQRAEDELRRLNVELKIRNQELQEALDKVKTLSGLLPICASCKKIRDDQGYWHQVEVYIKDHSDAEFSHSICPTCAEKLYPQYFQQR
jgi:hypothetical protein